ncbi:MAG: hypothetical protein AAFN77_19110 [Planctomycetota bacterium]
MTHPKIQLFFIGLVAAMIGCSDSRYEFKTPVKSGMSVRVSGKTKNRVLFHLTEYRMDDSGHESSWQSGNNQVCKSTGENLTVPLDRETDGLSVSIVVPFDDPVSLEVVHNGLVIESQNSSQAGTVLTLELGQLPKERDVPFADYKIDSRTDNFQKALFKSLQSEQPTKLAGYVFADTATEESFQQFISELENRCGPASKTEIEYWVAVPVEQSKMIQGMLCFADTKVPVIFGTNDADDGKSIDFVVVMFEPEGIWIPIEQWRKHIDLLDSDGAVSQ